MLTFLLIKSTRKDCIDRRDRTVQLTRCERQE